MSDNEAKALRFLARLTTKESERQGDIFLHHIVVVTAVHPDIHYVAGFDIVVGVFERHSRIDPAGAHDLVPDTWLSDCFNAGNRPKHVRQTELFALAVVEASTREERDCVE